MIAPLASKMELPEDRREMIELVEESARGFADPACTLEEVTDWFDLESQRLLEKWNAIS